jgi:hypothetical protein
LLREELFISLRIYLFFKINFGVLCGISPNNVMQLRILVTTEKIWLLVNCSENPQAVLD